MNKVNVIILNAVDTASQNGPAVDANQLIVASFVPTFGDVTAAGTVKIQCSNDLDTNAGYMGTSNFTPTNWADIPNATSTIASGVGPAILIPQMSFRWIRAVYTRTSGGSTTVQVAMFAMSL